ncbi:Sulfatase, partial [Operophtera brumata]
YGVKEAGGPSKVPPGWTEWHGLVGNSVYYDYTISNNGVPTHSTNEYLTDVINQTESQPFLMVLAPPAPHQPFTPAARHQGRFANVTADKHWLLQMPPSPLPASMLPRLDEVFRSRWEALLSVDEMVADVTDIKVPLLIKGPSVPTNFTNPNPVLNIDIAPTIIQLAGLQVPKKMDGRPIDINNGSLTERNMLIEYYGEGSNQTVDATCPWKYDSGRLSECYPQYECKCQDSRNNTFAFLPAIKHWYRLTLVQMLSCSGAECDHPFGVDEQPDNSFGVGEQSDNSSRVDDGDKKRHKRFKKKKCPF